jgi:thioredoxin-related protein
VLLKVLTILMTLRHNAPESILSRSLLANFYIMKFLVFFPLFLLSLPVSADDDFPYVEIKYATDFSQLAEQARTENKIIMVEVSASYCEYCELLEEEFIKPMLRSGDYTDVLIRKIDMDSGNEIKDFSGETTSPDEFTRRLRIKFTPTLLFFDGHGNEISPRILGINSLDLYGGYLDDALETGLQKIKSQ